MPSFDNYDRLDDETKIRLAVREHGVLSKLQGADMQRIGDPDYDADLPDIIERWTGIDPRTIEGGMDIVLDEAKVVRNIYSRDI